MTIKSIPRVVVTGHATSGRSTIIKDEIATHINQDVPGLILSDIWATNNMPVGLNDDPIIPNHFGQILHKMVHYFVMCRFHQTRS